jgi:hypothetical protein
MAVGDEEPLFALVGGDIGYFLSLSALTQCVPSC